MDVAARRDAQRAHLPAGRARRRRRRRHERLHRRDREAAGRAAASRSRSSPAPPSSDQPPDRRAVPGRHRPARHRRPVRGPGQGRPAGPAVRLHRRRHAGRGAPRPGLVRRHPLALLAVRPGRLAGPRALGRAARALGAHPGQGQERAAGRRRRPRAARPRHRRGAGRRRGRPADRLDRRRGRRARSSSTAPTRGRVRTVAPGVDLDVFTPGARRGGPGPARPARRTR